MKNNILITGGCGFIGSSFIDLLLNSKNLILLISINLHMHQQIIQKLKK